MKTYKKERGAVSLFIVIFAALLITTVTISFIHLMLNDQQQATANDLSQSAYDSAKAGVEDAKRAILRYQVACSSGDAAGIAACAKTAADINSSICNQGLVDIGINPKDSEVKVQQTNDSSASALDQAYTCVKIKLATSDYIGTLGADSSKVIPLKGTGDFNTVKLEWYNSANLPSPNNADVSLIGISDPLPLLHQLSGSSGWPANRPPIMRTQLMQFGSGFSLSDFDDVKNGQSDANTLFLYPTSGVTAPTTPFSGNDTRKTPTGAPRPTTCISSLGSGGYACSVTINLPDPINAGSRTAYLRLGALYNAANYRVTLLNSAAPVTFDAVQPEIDSTGRANDLFRRVSSRVELTDINFAYPTASVDISGNFCKDFLVTDNPLDYKNTSCTP